MAGPCSPFLLGKGFCPVSHLMSPAASQAAHSGLCSHPEQSHADQAYVCAGAAVRMGHSQAVAWERGQWIPRPPSEGVHRDQEAAARRPRKWGEARWFGVPWQGHGWSPDGFEWQRFRPGRGRQAHLKGLYLNQDVTRQGLSRAGVEKQGEPPPPSTQGSLQCPHIPTSYPQNL